MHTNRIISLFILILGTASFNALLAQKITFEGGVLLGIYGVDVTGDKVGFWEYDYKKSGILGISAGPFVKCHFNREVYGVLELRYSGKGTTYGYINQYFTQSFETIRFNYIEIPLLIGTRQKVNSDNQTYDLTFESGFAFARLFSSNLKYMDITRRPKIASLSGFKNFDVTWIAQVKFPCYFLKQDQFMLGFRIEHSIVSINTDFKLFNFGYGVELNYIFRP
jgi:hypothetical protein